MPFFVYGGVCETQKNFNLKDTQLAGVKIAKILGHPMVTLVIGFVLGIYSSYVSDCLGRGQVACSIYHEVLTNYEKVETCIDMLEKNGKPNTKLIVFSTAVYDKSYKPGLFGGNDLDSQLQNFYANCRSYSSLYNLADYKRMEEQGRQSLQKLSTIGKIRDYDATNKPEGKNTGKVFHHKKSSKKILYNAVSADVSTFDPENAASATTIKLK